MDTAAEERSIRASEAQWVQQIAAKNVEAMVAHYTDDAALMPPGMPAAKGKEAIRAMLKMMLDDPNVKLTFSPDLVSIAKGGDLAYSQGSYEMTMTDPATKKPVTDKGSYVTVYRKQADGRWLAAADINTSSVPPAAPAPSK